MGIHDHIPAIEFARRPYKKVEDCRLGRTFNVKSNAFEMAVKQNIDIHVYNVRVQRKRMVMKNKKKIDQVENVTLSEGNVWFYAAVLKYPHIFCLEHSQMVYNDAKVLWTTKRLGFYDTEKLHLSRINAKGKERTAELRLEYSHKLSVDFNCLSPYTSIVQEVAQFLSYAITQSLRSPLFHESDRFVSSRGAVFLKDRSSLHSIYTVPVGQGLEMWSGFRGTVVPGCEAGILYHCDVAQAPFFKQNFNIVEFYVEVVHSLPFTSANPDLHMRYLRNCCINKRNRILLDLALKDHQITFRCGDKQKSYAYGGIGEKSAAAQTIKLNGVWITVERYFFDFYRQRLNFPNLPCIKLGGSSVWIPMEFCYTSCEPTKMSRKLNEDFTTQMVQKSAILPSIRRDMIRQLTCGSETSSILHLPTTTSSVMNHLGIDIKKKLLDVKASLLPPPTLVFGNDDKYRDDHRGMWEVRQTDPDRYRAVLKPQEKLLIPGIIFIKESHALSLLVACHDTENDGNQLELLVKEYKDSVLKHFGPDALPLLFFICPSKDSGRKRGYTDYDYIKYVCDTVVGVHSQVILKKNYAKCRGNILNCSIAHHVVMKILAKIGAQHYTLEREGEHKNWTRLTNPKEPTLLLGVHVLHPDQVSRERGGRAELLSMGCVVGNIDLQCMQYRSSVHVHPGGPSKQLSITKNVKEHINKFVENTSLLPKHIVVFRDGVGDSQFSQTLYADKTSIESAWRLCSSEDLPTITYIVTSKTHNTRFFPLEPEDCESESMNLKPGTLVESCVTSASKFDFFLISHVNHSNRGTVRPTHYTVLYDSWEPSPAFWQTITHCLTYAFVRTSRSLSRPAPLMYARLAAKKGKDYVCAHYGRAGNMNKGSCADFLKTAEAIPIHDQLGGMTFL